DTWWDSPWGRGRPGWHIECSAMAEKFLGPSFDIHLGGLDLVFPHHENERAQSQAAGREFARIWMHNGLLRLNREKMSKSVGNIAPLKDVLERWGRETVLLFFMTGHWSKPIDFSDETMTAAQARGAKAESGVRDGDRPRVQTKLERGLSEAAGTRDHQGVVAGCEPYRYADGWELAAAERPLLACLDQVTDPRNLGAVVRSADGAGATGVVVPAHGAATVTPAVCRASAGAVEHVSVAVVPNLARYLGEVKGGDLWVFGAVGDGAKPMWATDLSGGVALVFGAEGKGVRPLVRKTCDD